MRRVIEVYPQTSDVSVRFQEYADFYLGCVSYRRRKFRESISHFKRSLEIDRQSRTYRRWILSARHYRLGGALDIALLAFAGLWVTPIVVRWIWGHSLPNWMGQVGLVGAGLMLALQSVRYAALKVKYNRIGNSD